MKLSKVQENIISLLADKELSALQIQRELERLYKFNSFWGLRSIYIPLYELERYGLIKARMGIKRPEERGGNRTRYYQLTQDGMKLRRELLEKLASIVVGLILPNPY